MRHTRKKRLQLTRASSAFRQSPNGGNGNGPELGVGGVLDPSLMEPGLLQQLRVKYRTMRFAKDGTEKEDESEALISGDDDDLLIGAKVGGSGGLIGGSGVSLRSTGGGGSQSIQMA